MKACSMPVVFTQNFLQKNDVRSRTANRIAKFAQDKAPVEYGKALMYVDGQYLDCLPGSFWHAMLHQT